MPIRAAACFVLAWVAHASGADEPSTLPISGVAVAELKAFDDAMLRFMAERSIRAGTLAVSKDGKLVLARGYGHADAAGKQPLSLHAPMRLASIGKPITAAAILKLIREGKLRADTKVFALLGIEPISDRRPDPRLSDITVRHLLDHQGGWDRERAFDPMFRPLRISSALGKQPPAQAADVIRYMLGQPLQFDPGTETQYSNFGYCVLGRVIEKVTGTTYIDYIRHALLGPLDIRSVELGRTLPRDRNPKEPFYSDPGTGRNVMQPDGKEEVAAPDGGFHLEAMDSHGGLIGSAPDLVRFLDAYWLTGEPRSAKGKPPHLAFGSLPGTFTMLLQRRDGVNVAVLFNQRTDPSGLEYSAIRARIANAAEAVERWPGASR